MPKIIEVIDSLNNENAEEIREALKTEASALVEKNSQLYQRAKKAEGFEFNRESKQWVKKEIKPEVKPEIKSEPPAVKPNEPDYAKLAFLETKGIVHPDDQKVVQDEANRLNLPLTDILGMEHIKSKLTASKEQRDALAGMPKGRGSSGGKTQQDVDYWLAKGETPDDLELAEKVIDARMKKEQSANKFSSELFSG